MRLVLERNGRAATFTNAGELISKVCSLCKKFSPISEYGRTSKGDRHGYDTRCNACKWEQQRARRMAKSPEERSAIARRENLWNLYRITVEEYDNKLQAQNGVCAICGEGPRHFRDGKLLPLCVEHDHKTGQN